MRTIELPPLEVLLDRFEYNPETGELLHKNPKVRWIKPGTPAGYDNGRGWLRVKIDDRHYKVARIVWKMYYGEDPPEGMHIDHVNRDRSDNRIENLRAVTNSENVRNSIRVLNAKGKPPKKTPEEIARIRKEAGKKTRKAVILINPEGEEMHYSSITEAAERNNLSQGCLSIVAAGKRKATKGFTARYAD